MNFYFNNKYVFSAVNIPESYSTIDDLLHLKKQDYYLLSNGKQYQQDVPANNTVHIIPKLVGGKGGFGSMLRAIGAQIEKTTNREACRDLSGRRLRDINEEKRLQTWIDQQADREKSASDRKQKKLERLCEEPKYVFKDEEYDKERSELPDRVESAVVQGMEAAATYTATTSGGKRKLEVDVKKLKKRKIWLDDDMSDLSTSDEDSNEDNKIEKVKNTDEKSAVALS